MVAEVSVPFLAEVRVDYLEAGLAYSIKVMRK